MKHHLVASFYASLTSALSLIIIVLLEKSGATVLGGLLLVPVVFVCCVVLSFPLIFIRSRLKLKKWQSVILFVLTGFILSATIPLLMFPWFAIDLDSIVVLLSYGFVGIVASSTAWFYVHRNIEI